MSRCLLATFIAASLLHAIPCSAQTGDGSLRGYVKDQQGGVLPGVLVGAGLMIYSHFFGPVGVMRKRSSFGEVTEAVKGAA